MDVASASPEEESAEPRRRWFAGVNRIALVGATVVAVGGLSYAAAVMAYTNLVGATTALSYGWVYSLEGLAFILVGLGLFLAFLGLGRSSIRIGGVVSLLGGILAGAGYFAYAADWGQASALDLLWTNQLEALGFFVVTVGIMLGLAGLAIHGTETAPIFRRRIL